MYGGLFGDLPAAKNDPAKKESSSSKESGTNSNTDAGTTTSSSVLANVGADAGNGKAQDSNHAITTTGGSVVPTNVGSTKSAVPARFIPRFVPTQAMRPRPQQQQRKRQLSVTTTTNEVSNGSTSTTATTTTSVRVDQQVTVPTSAADAGPSAANSEDGSPIHSATTAPAIQSGLSDTATVAVSKKVTDPPMVVATNSAVLTTTASGNDTKTRGDTSGAQVNPSSPVTVQQQQQQESLELTLLHAKAKTDDPYDPFVPNDLLLYWERKAIAVEREKLLQLQQERLREQEALRQQLEQERSIVEQQGDVDQIIQHRLRQQQSSGTVQGIGRGRGVTNLPAWLVEKQKRQQQQQQQQAQQYTNEGDRPDP